jgi:trehalose 6-phosphate phosphatase
MNVWFAIPAHRHAKEAVHPARAQLTFWRHKQPAAPLAAPPTTLSLAECALFLDVDGALVDFGAHPTAVTADAQLRALLQRLAWFNRGAVALVSSRSIGYLDALLAPLRLPMAGLNGFERRDADGLRFEQAVPNGRPLDAARELMMQLAEKDSRLLLEDKRLAIALHYRQVPRLEGTVVNEVQQIAELVGGLQVRRGAMVVEVGLFGASKASAIAGFMREPPFIGRRPVFVGADDSTDEPAFEWVNAAAGVSVGVNIRRPTAATTQVPSVSAVREWLSSLAAADTSERDYSGSRIPRADAQNLHS